MGLFTTYFNLKTLGMRLGLQRRISEEMLFEMPRIGLDPAIILGATRATALIAAAAVEAGHERFFVTGGKEVGKEDPRFTRLLIQSLEKAGLPLPSSPAMKEHEYGREILEKHFGIASGSIITRDYDQSTNLQQNMEVLQRAGYAELGSAEFYTLAGTARRVIGTARKVWSDDAKPISAHNVYPTGINRDNWMNDMASAFYAISEADKVLAAPGRRSGYERRGFCTPVHVSTEIARVNAYNDLARAYRAAPKADGPA